MCVQRKFWEIQQNFGKIRSLCIQKCMMVAKEKREQIDFFEALVNHCSVILLKAEQMCAKENIKQKKNEELAKKGYLQGASFRQMQEVLLQKTLEENSFLEKKTCIEEAYRCGYKALEFFMPDAVDYELYENKTKFDEWNGGENPYAILQNIGKKDERKKLSLEDTAVLFRDILSALSEKKAFDETVKDIEDKLKNRGSDFCGDFFGNI